jgi:hypothetical protein
MKAEIRVSKENGQVIAWVGPKATSLFRLKFILRGLRFEIETGMRLTNKAPKCSTIVRREFGLKGRPPKLLAQFTAIVDQIEAKLLDNDIDIVEV